MPIYEYQCKNCGHHIEILANINDEKLSTCTKCGSEDFHRIISSGSFRLSGSGWYETDFKTSKKRNVVEKANSGKTNEKP